MPYAIWNAMKRLWGKVYGESVVLNRPLQAAGPANIR